MKKLWLIFIGLTILILPFHVKAAAPSVSTVRIGVSANGPNVSPLNVSPNSTTTYYVNGTVSDADGFSDILSVSAVVYRSGVTNGVDCTADNNNCYRPSTCNLSNGSGNTVDYSCQFAIQYYADPTDAGDYASETWMASVRVTDTEQSVDDSTYNTELNSMLAISTSPEGLDFGILDMGATSNSVRVDVKNTGNVPADSLISSAGNMTCTHGTILVANQKYGRTDDSYASLEYTLSTTPSYSTLTLPAQTDDATIITDELYFRILIPSENVNGTCNGTININATIPQM